MNKYIYKKSFFFCFPFGIIIMIMMINIFSMANGNDLAGRVSLQQNYCSFMVFAFNLGIVKSTSRVFTLVQLKLLSFTY